MKFRRCGKITSYLTLQRFFSVPIGTSARAGRDKRLTLIQPKSLPEHG